MNTSRCTVALFLLSLPAWAMAQQTPANQPSLRDISHVAGSIYPTVVQLPSAKTLLAPQAVAPAMRPADIRNIGAVCMSSSAHAERCPRQSTKQATTVAFCDMQDAAFRHCLAHYASLLVKHPEPASQVVTVAVRNAQNGLDTVTVLKAPGQTQNDINQLVAHDIPGSMLVTGKP